MLQWLHGKQQQHEFSFNFSTPVVRDQDEDPDRPQGGIHRATMRSQGNLSPKRCFMGIYLCCLIISKIV